MAKCSAHGYEIGTVYFATSAKRYMSDGVILKNLLGDDVDGIWSECCDGYGDNVSASVDEVVELHRAYKVALMEQDRIKGEKVEA